jgi:hypothetical protein
MGSIYACAGHTIIFNSSTAEAELFLDTVRTCNNHLRNELSGGKFSLKHCKDLWASTAGHFVNQAWLAKIWDLQELLFSRDPWVQCGTARLRWDDFCKYPQLVEELSPIRESLATSNASRGPLKSNTDNYQTTKGLELLLGMAKLHRRFYDSVAASYGHTFLLEWLLIRTALGVTDPRGMIFAHTIVARSADGTEKYPDLIQIDCGKDCALVYEYAARYFSETRNAFSIFLLVEDVDLKNRRPGMVSWAPGWSLLLPLSPWTSLDAWSHKNSDSVHSYFAWGAPDTSPYVHRH